MARRGLQLVILVSAVAALVLPVPLGEALAGDGGSEPIPTTTLPATNITSSSATLNGAVSNSEPSEAYFDYGANTAYGYLTGRNGVAAGTNVPANTDLTGLTPNTTYHFRASTLIQIGDFILARGNGSDASFTTLASTETPPTTPPPVTGLPALPVSNEAIKFPSTRTDPKSCKSRRKFRIRIVQPPDGITYTQVQVFVNNKKVKTVTRNRVMAPVNLRDLPYGTFKVKIVVTTSDGRTLTGTRKYKTCRKKRGGKRKHKL